MVLRGSIIVHTTCVLFTRVSLDINNLPYMIHTYDIFFSLSRNGSASEVPQKPSPATPRSTRGNKSGNEIDTSGAAPARTSSDRSPKVTERRSPRSPAKDVSFYHFLSPNCYSHNLLSRGHLWRVIYYIFQTKRILGMW